MIDDLTPFTLRQKHKSDTVRDLVELAVVRSGSRAYGLSTPESDVDTRAIFAHRTIDHVLGMAEDKSKHAYHFIVEDQGLEYDYAYGSIQHFMRDLVRGSFQSYEMLHSPEENVVYGGRFWDTLRAARTELVNVRRLHCVAHSILNQSKEGYDWGGSPKSLKNLMHGLRIAEAVTVFLNTNRSNYPVTWEGRVGDFGYHLQSVRDGRYTQEQLESFARSARTDLDQALKNTDPEQFNNKLAVELVRSYYFDR